MINIVSNVLARIINLKVYGMIVLVTAFTDIMKVFMDRKLSGALI